MCSCGMSQMFCRCARGKELAEEEQQIPHFVRDDSIRPFRLNSGGLLEWQHAAQRDRERPELKGRV